MRQRLAPAADMPWAHAPWVVVPKLAVHVDMLAGVVVDPVTAMVAVVMATAATTDATAITMITMAAATIQVPLSLAA